MRGKRQPIPKVPTNIAGLDEILEGGLPQGRTTVVSGGPGSGKTVLGLEFLCRGAMAGEPGVFITFEERADAIRLNAQAMGWDLASLEKAGKMAIIEARLPGEEIVAGDFDIQGMLAIAGGHIKRIGAQRIVMDALDVLLRIYDDSKREHNELSRLHDWLTDQGLTSVLSVKTHRDNSRESQYEFLDFMADCVIQLDHRVVGQVATRRLRVIKYRGSGFGTNEYPYVFGEHGIVLFPLTTTELTHQPLGPKVSTGLDGLDLMLDGGFRRASCILISGNSGTGKTTLASTLARAACLRGERVLYLNFEESKEAMISGMLRAYPITEHKLTPCVEEVEMDVVCSLHGGEHALRLVRSVCADARENVASIGAAVAQVSAQSEGRSASRESARRRQWNLLSVAHGLPMEGVAAAVRLIQHGASLLPRMEPPAHLPSLLEEMSANV